MFATVLPVPSQLTTCRRNKTQHRRERQRTLIKEQQDIARGDTVVNLVNSQSSLSDDLLYTSGVCSQESFTERRPSEGLVSIETYDPATSADERSVGSDTDRESNSDVYATASESSLPVLDSYSEGCVLRQTSSFDSDLETPKAVECSVSSPALLERSHRMYQHVDEDDDAPSSLALHDGYHQMSFERHEPEPCRTSGQDGNGNCSAYQLNYPRYSSANVDYISAPPVSPGIRREPAPTYVVNDNYGYASYSTVPASAVRVLPISSQGDGIPCFDSTPASNTVFQQRRPTVSLGDLEEGKNDQ